MYRHFSNDSKKIFSKMFHKIYLSSLIVLSTLCLTITCTLFISYLYKFFNFISIMCSQNR